MANELILKNFSAKSFLRIDKSKPVVFSFPQGKNAAKITKLSGNQETGKTSTLSGIAYLLGGYFNIDVKEFVNKVDGTIEESITLTKDGKDIVITASGATGRITVKEAVKDTDRFTTVSSPKEFIRDLCGPLGVSPMFLKDLAGKKQIQWFKDTHGSNPKIQKQEEEIVKNINDKFETRKETNREIKTLKGALDASPLYANYEKNLEKFKTPISADKEKKKFEEITAKKKDFDRYSETLDKLKEAEADQLELIKELEEKLEAAKKEAAELNQRIVKGKTWIEENKSVKKEYEVAEKEWLNTAQKLADYTAWKDILAKEKQYNERLDESQTLDAEIDQLRTDLLELTQKYLPKIKGLTIKVKTSLDSEEEGIYYEGLTLAQLSESQLWELFMQIWEAKGVQFVFLENINSLGSDAIEQLNKLAKAGTYIFASEMDRTSNEMQVTFETKIQ